MQFLGKLVPNIARAVLLVNPASPELAGQQETAQQAARALGWQLQVTEARSEQEIDTAFADAKRQRADAVIVSADPFFRTRYKQLVAQAARHGLPASYFAREFVMAATATAFRTRIDAQVSRPAVSLEALSRPSCRSTALPSSSW